MIMGVGITKNILNRHRLFFLRKKACMVIFLWSEPYFFACKKIWLAPKKSFFARLSPMVKQCESCIFSNLSNQHEIIFTYKTHSF